ncbi:MAG: hypothetical protein CML08_00260 [Puniceicoccaceae bacterium]|nr:hypothetical protein [Puniceicoccaceae bacterium]
MKLNKFTLPHMFQCIIIGLAYWLWPFLSSISLVTESAADEVNLGLNVAPDSIEFSLAEPENPIEILEYSNGLSDWVTITRNYGSGWERTFPFAYPIENTGISQSILTLPKQSKGFFRKRSSSLTDYPSNKEIASRFLLQATFGPTLEAINNFPNINSENFIDDHYSNFEIWIDQQISLTPFLHRAYWRQRSDPDFVDWAWRNDYLINEVGHNPQFGHSFGFYRGQVYYSPDWRCPLPGHGGLFDSSGNPIDPTNYEENQLDWEGIPKIGSHVNDANQKGMSIWDLRGVNNDDFKKIVWFESAINANDQLRQRIAWALSQYFVVSEKGSNQSNLNERWLNFYDIFVRNAFGNFRDILREVTWSPHMGYYLSYIENKKADPAKGTFPDENFARELMQLFTIGIWELNEDGTLEIDDYGEAIPTYDINDVTEFAKVFTGLRRPFDRANIEISFGNYIDPMRVQANRHDFSAKTLLDGTMLGPFSQNEIGVRSDIEGLLEHLFNHKNMPPFFAHFLIQRLTISNPSPTYIKSVAEAFKTGLFNGSGTGNRGDMVATIKAVLLHPEARSHALAIDSSHGKLREPIIRLMHLCRAFKLDSIRTYEWIYFKNLEDDIIQSPYESSSVFNFYRPDYSPNGVIAKRSLHAPEFQIHNDVSALKLLNYYHILINEGIIEDETGNFGSRWYVEADLDFSYEATLANNLELLINHLDLVLCGGRLSESTKTLVLQALEAKNAQNAFLSDIACVRAAVYLIACTLEFNTLY